MEGDLLGTCGPKMTQPLTVVCLQHLYLRQQPPFNLVVLSLGLEEIRNHDLLFMVSEVRCRMIHLEENRKTLTLKFYFSVR